VIGWAFDDHLHTDLVESRVDARRVGCRGRLPRRPRLSVQLSPASPGSLIGTTSSAQSGAPGVLDNAAAESFWKTLEVEFYDRYLCPPSTRRGSPSVTGIEQVYNRHRRHSALRYDQPGSTTKTDSIFQTAEAA